MPAEAAPLPLSGRLARGGLPRSGPSTRHLPEREGVYKDLSRAKHGAAMVLQSRGVDEQAQCRPVSIAYGVGREGACLGLHVVKRSIGEYHEDKQEAGRGG